MIQIALYHSALHELFAQHDTGEQDIHFVGHRDGAVWLPISRPDGSAQDTSSQAALEHFPVSVLLPRVRDLLQSVIPGLLKKRQPELDWHLNPICKPCDFSDRCREEVGERFGSLPGISLSDRAVLQTVRRCEFGADEISDIEDLLSNPDGAGVQPQKLKQVRKILKASGTGESALIQARRLGTSVLLPGPNLHLPKHEDVAVFIYLLTNPESEDFVLENGTAGAIRSGHAFGLLAAYEIRISCTCESPQSFFESASPSNHRRAEGEMLSKSLVRDLASIMRTLDGLKSKPIVQFYCWSALEVRVLNRILLAAAVQSQLDGNSWVDLQDDVESCIAALVTDPAACTSPIVPSPFEQSYFSGLFEAAHQATKKGNSRTLPLEVLKKLWLSFRSQTEPKSMTAAKKTIKHGLGDAASKALNGKTGGSRFPRILDLEGSMKHTVVLPVAGWVAFMDYLRILLPKKESTPSEGDLFDLWRTEQTDRLHGSLHRRLQLMEALLKRTRRLARNALRFDASHWFAHLVPELGAPAILGPAERALLRRLFFIEEHEHNLKLRQLQLERSARDTAIQLRLINEFNYEFSVVDQNQVAQLELDSSGGSNAHLRFSRYILGRESDADDFADFKDLAFASAMMKAHAFSAAESIGNLSFASIASIYRNDAGQICCRAVLDNNINIGHRDRDSLFILRDRLFDLNYPKVMKMLFFYGQTGGSNTLFTKLLLRPHDGGGSPADSTAWKENGDKIQELWEKLRRSDAAVPLSMTYSQRLAFESMTDSRLTVIWGPPGAGKTHTLALSCTRFLHIAWRIQEKPKMRILFTATTTAAIETFLRKLFDLIDLASEQQALIEGFEGFKWAENASANVSLLTTGEVFHGKKAILGHYRNQSVNGGGQNQDTGAENGNGDQNRDVWICAGTIWQVYKWVDGRFLVTAGLDFDRAPFRAACNTDYSWMSLTLSSSTKRVRCRSRMP